MRNGKIGIVTVSLGPELSTVPPEAIQIADRYGERVEKGLSKKGLEVIRIKEQIQNEKDSVRAVKNLANEGVDCIVFLVGSWVYAPIVVTAAMKISVPFMLWALPDMVLSSLVPSCMIHGSLDEMGIKHKFIYGLPEDSDTIEQIVRYVRACSVVNKMKGSKYGLIGGRCMYMYTAMPDLVQVKRIFEVETEHIDQYVLVLKAQKIDEKKISEYFSQLEINYGNIEPSRDIMTKSIRIYFALKEIVQEKNLDFLGIKCIPEMVENYASCCLAVSQLNNEGIVTACEADTNGALTMQILHLLSQKPVGFADVFDINKKNREIRLVNCGSLPTEFAASKKDVDWGSQYKFIGSSGGTTTLFVCKPGRITLARLARIKGTYVMQISTGEAYSQPKEKMKEAREKWPHLFFRLDGDPVRFLQNCRSNHQHWVYGDYKEELTEICNLLKIEPIIT